MNAYLCKEIAYRSGEYVAVGGAWQVDPSLSVGAWQVDPRSASLSTMPCGGSHTMRGGIVEGWREINDNERRVLWRRLSASQSEDFKSRDPIKALRDDKGSV